MADLPSGPPVKVNDVEVNQDTPITEALLNKLGVDINYLIDEVASLGVDIGNIELTQQQFLTSGGNVGIGTNPIALDSGGVNLQIKDRSALFQLAANSSAKRLMPVGMSFTFLT